MDSSVVIDPYAEIIWRADDFNRWQPRERVHAAPRKLTR
jgi:hypothetical protein